MSIISTRAYALSVLGEKPSQSKATTPSVKEVAFAPFTSKSKPRPLRRQSISSATTVVAKKAYFPTALHRIANPLKQVSAMFWTAQSTFSETFRAYTDAYPNEWRKDLIEQDKRLARGAEIEKGPPPQEEQRMKSSHSARAADGAKTNKIAPAASGENVAGTTDVKLARTARKGHSFVVGPAS